MTGLTVLAYSLQLGDLLHCPSELNAGVEGR